jgi:adenylate cyclase
MKPVIRRHNRNLWIFLIILFSTGVGLFISVNPNFQHVEENRLDMMFEYKAGPLDEKIPDVVIVMIDEKSYEADFGYYDPIPRRYIARLIDTLAAKGAKAIAVDIAFYDKLAKLDARGDSVLVRSMKHAGNVIAVSIWHAQDDGSFKIQMPHPFFKAALKGVGYANLEVSGGGVLASVREVKPIETMSDGKTLLSFSALTYCTYMNLDPAKFMEEVQSRNWEIVPRIPLSEKNAMIINYVGPPSTWIKQPDGLWTQKSESRIVTYRSSSLTSDIFWPGDLFKNKVVFIGNGSEFVPDKFITPFYKENINNWMYGAEVHANAFLTLATKNFIQRTSFPVEALMLLLIAVIMVLATVRFGFTGEMSVAIVLFVVIWGSGYLLFSSFGLWLPVTSMWITMGVAYFSTSIYQAFTEERNKKQIKNMFERYAPPAYVDILIKDPSKLELGGEEKEISILFSDIEGFTSISENLGPKELVGLLNDYLGAMTKLIFDQGGSLDKYIGDAIVAVFGAPLPQNEHALHACYAALDMQKVLIEFRKKLSEKGLPPIKNRIGINTGKVVFGNIGSDIRYDYTGIGDHMNLASRLESANKQYGTYLMISEFTYLQVRERVIVRDLDVIVVKGKSKPVKVFELIGKANEPLAEDIRKMVEFYQDGIDNYREMKWTEAIQKFEQALTFSHNDEPSKMYIQRCKDFIANPPPGDWDGTYHMTTK